LEQSWHWRLTAPHALAWRELDDELVVYNDATGNTHHFSQFGGIVLLTLVAHPSGVDMNSLVSTIGVAIQPAARAFLSVATQEALEQLAALRLAERFLA
jgi:hypothetical protein